MLQLSPASRTREAVDDCLVFGTLVPGAQGPEPMRSWYFSLTSDVTLGDYGRAVGRSLRVK